MEPWKTNPSISNEMDDSDEYIPSWNVQGHIMIRITSQDHIIHKCVEALGRIIIRGPYPSSNAIIYMHFYEWRCFPVFVLIISYFLFQIISFKKHWWFRIFYFRLSVWKSIFVSLGNNFFVFFCGGPLAVEAPGQLPSFPPPLNPAVGM